MFKSFIVCLVVFAALVSNIYGKLPPDVKRCRAGDGPCMVNSANYVIKTRFLGDRDLNLVSIDPLRIDNMTVIIPRASPMHMEIKFRNCIGTGYKNIEFRKMIGFGENPEGKHTLYLDIPGVAMLGDYRAEGNVYHVPVHGDGRVNITFEDTAAHLVISASSKFKNGLTYMHVEDVKVYADTIRAYFDFTNLIEGDELLSDALNNFMKENWQAVYLQIRRPILDAYGLLFTKLFRLIFDSTPYSQLVDGGL